VVVERGDRIQPQLLKKIKTLEVLQYHRRKLFLVSTTELNKLSSEAQKKLTIRDDFNLIQLRNLYFDTTVEQPEVSPGLRLVKRDKAQLHLV
jgi:hypothetical protein